jgi:ribosomal protein L7/L12
MIPSEHKVDIIQTGMSFMRAITEAYGTDEGMKLWDNIASVLDPDVKGQIFFAMLTGDYTNVIHVTGHQIGSDRVRMIKAIRNVDKRGIGLKEAKDMCDELTAGRPFKLEINPQSRALCLSELRKAGFYA